jgi:hypothetical protein
MIISLKNLVALVCVGILLATPMFSFMEVVALFKGTLSSQTEALTPTFIKALRDLAALMILLIAAVKIVLTRTISTHVLIYSVFLVLTLLGILFSFQSSLFLTISGVRWTTFFFLSFLLIGFADESLLKRISTALFFLFLFHFLIQVLQLFFMQRWYGVNALGLSARSPGMFLIPNTGALFSILCLFFSMFYQWGRLSRGIVFTLVPLSVLLTASGTALFVYVLMMLLFVIHQRYLLVAIPALAIAGVFLFPALMLLTGRGQDYIEISLGTRLEIFLDAFRQASIWPIHFGVGTNSGVSFAQTLGLESGAMIVDSTYTSILINLGYSGAIFFIICLLIWGFGVLMLASRELIVFTVMFGAFAVTTILSETFPANLLGAILLGKYLTTNFKIHLTDPAKENVATDGAD